jgi:hypothetical protein
LSILEKKEDQNEHEKDACDELEGHREAGEDSASDLVRVFLNALRHLFEIAVDFLLGDAQRPLPQPNHDIVEALGGPVFHLVELTGELRDEKSNDAGQHQQRTENHRPSGEQRRPPALAQVGHEGGKQGGYQESDEDGDEDDLQADDEPEDRQRSRNGQEEERAP